MLSPFLSRTLVIPLVSIQIRTVRTVAPTSSRKLDAVDSFAPSSRGDLLHSAHSLHRLANSGTCPAARLRPYALTEPTPKHPPHVGDRSALTLQALQQHCAVCPCRACVYISAESTCSASLRPGLGRCVRCLCCPHDASPGKNVIHYRIHCALTCVSPQ